MGRSIVISDPDNMLVFEVIVGARGTTGGLLARLRAADHDGGTKVRLPQSFATAEGGYGLLEMLIALAISGVLIGVLLQFAVSAHTSAGVQGEMADLQQRLRVAVETIRHEIMLAGAGPSRGQARGGLSQVFAPIAAARTGTSGADPELSFHADRISLLYVPDNAAQSHLVSDMVASGSSIVIDGAAPGCRPGSACGFLPGNGRRALRGDGRRRGARSLHDR